MEDEKINSEFLSFSGYGSLCQFNGVHTPYNAVSALSPRAKIIVDLEGSSPRSFSPHRSAASICVAVVFLFEIYEMAYCVIFSISV